ncbi:MAG: transposase [Calditrichaceae bacterium]|nr:transposase [Calditrichaceae bacterium]MBN2708982.1 transposase [Calditrichaceae bacterium]
MNIYFFPFQRKFSTDRKCYHFLCRKRWPDGFKCPRYDHDKYSFHSTRKLYQCKNCNY